MTDVLLSHDHHMTGVSLSHVNRRTTGATSSSSLLLALLTPRDYVVYSKEKNGRLDDERGGRREGGEEKGEGRGRRGEEGEREGKRERKIKGER